MLCSFACNNINFDEILSFVDPEDIKDKLNNNLVQLFEKILTIPSRDKKYLKFIRKFNLPRVFAAMNASPSVLNDYYDFEDCFNHVPHPGVITQLGRKVSNQCGIPDLQPLIAAAQKFKIQQYQKQIQALKSLNTNKA